MTKAETACRWAKTATARIDGCTAFIRVEKDDRAKAQALDVRGNARAELDQFDLAMADFDAATRLWPQFGGPYIDRALVRVHRRDIDGAIGEYTALIRLAPDDSDGFDCRCWVRAIANSELDSALSDCNRAIAISPYDSHGYEDRAIVWYRRGEMSRVVADTDFALLQSPAEAQALYMRGLAKLALGQAEAGRADVAAARKAKLSEVKFLARWGLRPY